MTVRPLAEEDRLTTAGSVQISLLLQLLLLLLVLCPRNVVLPPILVSDKVKVETRRISCLNHERHDATRPSSRRRDRIQGRGMEWKAETGGG